MALLLCLFGGAKADDGKMPDGSVRWSDLPSTDTSFAPPSFETYEEWKARREWLIEQVRFAAGIWPEPEHTPVNAHVFGKQDRGDYTIEKVWFESHPGFIVAGNLYRPANISGKVPAVLCPHGHWEHGRLQHDEKCSVPARCITLARMGIIALAYDMIGFNDSKLQLQHNDERLFEPANALWGIGPLELQTWNSMRAVDFLLSLPEVDRNWMGVTGASGGGTQTFILTAIDNHVSAIAPVNMISSIMQGGCKCENAQTLRIETNNMEIAAIAAPRPLLMVSASGDWTQYTPKIEFPAVFRIYSLYGAENRVSNVHIDAPHNYNRQSREAMYPFMARWLLRQSGGTPMAEDQIRVEKNEDLLVFADGKTPEEMQPFDRVISQIKEDAAKQIDALKPTDREKLDKLNQIVGAGLRHAVATAWPGAGEVRTFNRATTMPAGLDARGMTLARKERPVPVAVIDGQGAGECILCVDADGRAAAGKLEDFLRRAKAESSRIILAEPFGTGINVADPNAKPPRGSTKFFSTFNRTDAAEAVFDLLTALSKMPLSASKADIPAACFVAFGRMGPLALAARAMVPADFVHRVGLRTVIDMNGLNGDSDEAYLKDLNLPNIRKIGGLKGLVAAAANGPIWFHNVGEHFPADWAEQAGKLNGARVKITREKASDEAILNWLAGGE